MFVSYWPKYLVLEVPLLDAVVGVGLRLSTHLCDSCAGLARPLVCVEFARVREAHFTLRASMLLLLRSGPLVALQVHLPAEAHSASGASVRRLLLRSTSIGGVDSLVALKQFRPV